jgi:hypothetical protein
MEPRSRWPENYVREGQDVMEYLRPKSAQHAHVKRYLVDRLEASERAMRVFYPRWRVNEMKLQAYINLPKWEQELREINASGQPIKVHSVIIPYTMAIVSTIVTYHLHTFTSRRPMLSVGTYKDESVLSAQNMETVLQYNADHTRLIRHLFHYLQDSQIYGFAAFRNFFKEDFALRTKRTKRKKSSLFGAFLGERFEATRKRELVYQGNDTISIDPFMFFPDPRVPMEEVNTRGEYVYWRAFEGMHMLLREEAEGNFSHVDAVSRALPHNMFSGDSSEDSGRHLLSGGKSVPGVRPAFGGKDGGDFVQLDQGSVEIIPRELGLGESTRPEKWLFTIANKDQIIQAEALDSDHGMHPVSIIEPYSLGYGFGHPSMVDYLGPLQDVISWLINSHIDNVRKVLNDVVVVDPNAIEMKDLKNPEPGKIIRLKRAAIGRDVRTVVNQLQVQDVTRGNIDDAQLFIRIGQLLSAVSDNVLGIQAAGGRKTATEIRTSSEAAVSRLAAQARVISAQGLVDLTKQWTLNIQQYITDDFTLMVLGKDGIAEERRITPEGLNGDFHFPVHDGTLPVDKIAAFDIWKEVFAVVLQDEQLRSEYSVPRMFEFISELGGAKNIEAMRLDAQSDEEIAKGQQAGNIVPISALGGGPSGLVNPTEANPRNRLAGALR